MAIHRNSELPLERENQFSDYPIFSKPIPFLPLDEPLSIHIENPCPFIKVDDIDINAMTLSSLAVIGNVGHIRMDARVKNIRNLLPGTNGTMKTY